MRCMCVYSSIDKWDNIVFKQNRSFRIVNENGETTETNGKDKNLSRVAFSGIRKTFTFCIRVYERLFVV